MFSSFLNDTEYNVGIYIRLSQEDKDKKYESESESVTNQRELLREYVKNNNLNLVEEYVDDGYSGTNFERPGFKRLLDDIHDNKINCVIVKDLSRLGRDHIMTGYYMETFFPENRIRFISLQEAYDSSKIQASNDSSTFIIACNDYYSKQNSIKIRTVLNEKRKKGKFIGSQPSYGYMRDPEDKGHLLPDPETAPIVKKIFEWRASGIGPTYIANRLNAEGVLTPSALKNTKYSSRLIDASKWNNTTVRKILDNRMYTGDMVQHTQTNLNYKSKKKVTLDKKLWVIVENTHEPIIDRETFEYCASLRKLNNRVTEIRSNRERRMFEGKLYCAECGNRLGVMYRRKENSWSVNCNRYVRDPVRRRCYPHFFAYNYLEEVLIDKINESIKKYIEDLDINKLNKEVAKKVKENTFDIDKSIKQLTNEKTKLTKRLTLQLFSFL
ncbi:MAG: recombinase family protein, partial [Clostridia bacterium]|nr:recombinase family protein [Clostridia bacterium]